MFHRHSCAIICQFLSFNETVLHEYVKTNTSKKALQIPSEIKETKLRKNHNKDFLA